MIFSDEVLEVHVCRGPNPNLVKDCLLTRRQSAPGSSDPTHYKVIIPDPTEKTNIQEQSTRPPIDGDVHLEIDSVQVK